MLKEVKIGDKVPVSIELEFEGTVKNSLIIVENTYIPLINNNRDNFDVILDGNPIHIIGRFSGVKGSKIKKFNVTINNKKGFVCPEIIFKYNIIEIKNCVDYKEFDLKNIDIV